MRTCFALASLILGTTTSSAFATAVYSVGVDCATSVSGSTSPVSASGSCPGVDHTTDAASSPGHVGVAIKGSDIGTGLNFAIFDTTVTFTATGGSTATSIPVSLNLALGGTAGGTLGSAPLGTNDFQTRWDVSGAVGSLNFDTTSTEFGSDSSGAPDFTSHTDTHIHFATGGETLSVGSDVVGGTLATDLVDVLVGVPTRLEFELGLQANSTGTFDMEFLSSLDLPKGSDVFTLPDGFTANDGDGIIVNNRFGSTAAVPEPPSLLLLITGLLSLALLSHVRRDA